MLKDPVHLQEQFDDKFIKDSLSLKLSIGNRTYDILNLLKAHETTSIAGHVMIKRAKERHANLGKDDGEYILAHQEEIPESLWNKIIFIFPNWRHPDNPKRVCCISAGNTRWVRSWGKLSRDLWGGRDRFLRRR